MLRSTVLVVNILVVNVLSSACVPASSPSGIAPPDSGPSRPAPISTAAPAPISTNAPGGSRPSAPTPGSVTTDTTAPPASTAAVAGAVTCMLAEDLAAQQGWPIYDRPESVTSYGGVRVLLTSETTLPPGWEAIFAGGRILAWDAERRLPAGIASLYPPPGACREELGVDGS